MWSAKWPEVVWRGLRGAAADQPDGRGAERDREDHEPARLDELHRPEPTDRDVARPVRATRGPHLEYPRGAWRVRAAEQAPARGVDRHRIVLAQDQPGQQGQAEVGAQGGGHGGD